MVPPIKCSIRRQHLKPDTDKKLIANTNPLAHSYHRVIIGARTSRAVSGVVAGVAISFREIVRLSAEQLASALAIAVAARAA